MTYNKNKEGFEMRWCLLARGWQFNFLFDIRQWLFGVAVFLESLPQIHIHLGPFAVACFDLKTRRQHEI